MNLLMPFVPYLRILVCIFLGLTLPSVGMAQTVFEGQVVDKETELAIPGVTVQLVKEKRATSTNNRGYYKLMSTDTIGTDSLLFTSVGYKSFRLAVKAYQANMFIVLEASATQLKDVTITQKVVPKPVLHKFSLSDLKEVRYDSKRGFNRTWPFSAKYMVAMQVKAKKKGVRIASVNIGRREYDQNYFPFGSLALPSPHTRFLVHVMSVNEQTGLPDKKLHTREVRLSDNAQMIVVDVSEDDWTVDGDSFFVAVEWLRVPLNEIVELGADELVKKTTKAGEQKLDEAPAYKIIYQPAITRFTDSRKYNAYFMNHPGVWQRVMHDKDRIPSTLAMSATIIE